MTEEQEETLFELKRNMEAVLAVLSRLEQAVDRIENRQIIKADE